MRAMPTLSLRLLPPLKPVYRVSVRVSVSVWLRVRVSVSVTVRVRVGVRVSVGVGVRVSVGVADEGDAHTQFALVASAEACV